MHCPLATKQKWLLSWLAALYNLVTEEKGKVSNAYRYVLGQCHLLGCVTKQDSRVCRLGRTFPGWASSASSVGKVDIEVVAAAAPLRLSSYLPSAQSPLARATLQTPMTCSERSGKSDNKMVT